jgi:GNAT superfamily N-acetyltransferase
MEIQIRRAVAEDCERILELVRELALYERAPHEVTVSLKHFSESGFGANPVWWAFVAVASSSNPLSNEEEERIHSRKILGFALYYIRFSTWKGQTMYLEDILVTEEMRGKNIGASLFERLIEEAKEKGLKRIVWQALEWNEPALNFYKKYNATFDKEWVNCAVDVE